MHIAAKEFEGYNPFLTPLPMLIYGFIFGMLIYGFIFGKPIIGC